MIQTVICTTYGTYGNAMHAPYLSVNCGGKPDTLITFSIYIIYRRSFICPTYLSVNGVELWGKRHALIWPRSSFPTSPRSCSSCKRVPVVGTFEHTSRIKKMSPIGSGIACMHPCARAIRWWRQPNTLPPTHMWRMSFNVDHS